MISKWPLRRWYFLGAIVILLVVSYLLSGFIQQWRSNSAVKSARTFWKAGDIPSTAITIQHALDLNPGNIAAWEFKAGVMSTIKDPNATIAWEQVARLNPTMTNWMNLLASSLKSGHRQTTTNAALYLEKNYPQDPSVIRLLSLYDISVNNLSSASQRLKQLEGLDPNNRWDSFNRSTLAMASTNSSGYAQAEQTLVQLSSLTNEVGLFSRRYLTQYYQEQKQPGRAMRMSEQLLSHPMVTWNDRCNHIFFVWSQDESQGRAALNLVLKSPLVDEQYANLAERLIRRDEISEAEKILDRCSPKYLKELPPLLLRIDAMQRGKRWRDMALLLEKKDLPKDIPVLELWRARSARELGQQRKSELHLQFVRQSTRQQPALQFELAAVLESWGWIPESRELLWQQASENSAPMPAILKLSTDYYKTGNTEKLGLTMDRWLIWEPASNQAKNNLAMTQLLLKTDVERAHRLAREAMDAEPTNLSFRTTAAYSLLLQKQTNEAVRLLSPVLARLTPSHALYAAATFQSSDPANARKLLAQVELKKLLPEEKRIYDSLSALLKP